MFRASVVWVAGTVCGVKVVERHCGAQQLLGGGSVEGTRKVERRGILRGHSPTLLFYGLPIPVRRDLRGLDVFQECAPQPQKAK